MNKSQQKLLEAVAECMFEMKNPDIPAGTLSSLVRAMNDYRDDQKSNTGWGAPMSAEEKLAKVKTLFNAWNECTLDDYTFANEVGDVLQ